MTGAIDMSRLATVGPMAKPVDMRGIVDPAAMLDHVDFDRQPPGDELEGLVEWFWSVAWDLPAGRERDQQVVNHPAGNISIGTIDDRGTALDPPEGRVYGVLQNVSSRHLAAEGWTVAARTTVGGLGAMLGRPAREVAGQQLPIGEALHGVDTDALVALVASLDENRARIDVVRSALAEVVSGRDPGLVREAREVVAVARVAELDRSVQRIDQLASVAGVSVRTLQRLFDQHVGASPAWVIRRWRIIDAVERTRSAIPDMPNSERPDSERPNPESWTGWAQVAAELGYADQAHLSRDFRHHLGVSPTAYLARQGR